MVSPGTADDPDDSDEDDPSDEDDDAPDGMWGRGRGYARWRRQCCNRCGVSLSLYIFFFFFFLSLQV